MDWPEIIFHMVTLTIGEPLGSGARLSNRRVGLSVASASAANVSMIRLIHRSWTTVKTDAFVPPDRAETMVRIPAVMLIVNWNC